MIKKKKNLTELVLHLLAGKDLKTFEAEKAGSGFSATRSFVCLLKLDLEDYKYGDKIAKCGFARRWLKIFFFLKSK